MWVRALLFLPLANQWLEDSWNVDSEGFWSDWSEVYIIFYDNWSVFQEFRFYSGGMFVLRRNGVRNDDIEVEMINRTE
jgi:hypothetical protein